MSFKQFNEFIRLNSLTRFNKLDSGWRQRPLHFSPPQIVQKTRPRPIHIFVFRYCLTIQSYTLRKKNPQVAGQVVRIIQIQIRIKISNEKNLFRLYIILFLQFFQTDNRINHSYRWKIFSTILIYFWNEKHCMRVYT